MEPAKRDTEWENLSAEEKKRCLYEKQMAMLKNLYAHGAISKEQFDISSEGLTTKMGMKK